MPGRSVPARIAQTLVTDVGRPREHLEFTLWYLGQKGYIDRSDGSKLTITASGVEYFEEHSTRQQNRLRLTAAEGADHPVS